MLSMPEIWQRPAELSPQVHSPHNACVCCVYMYTCPDNSSEALRDFSGDSLAILIV